MNSAMPRERMLATADGHTSNGAVDYSPGRTNTLRYGHTEHKPCDEPFICIAKILRPADKPP